MKEYSLPDTRAYEKKKALNINDAGRPLFHLSPMAGWMNDPNGFSFYDGQYHMFYQYYPFDNVWGPMHWGHAVSDDLIRWNYMPCALAPDSDIDYKGCFSGSAITDKDGRHLLIYTGVVEDQADTKSPKRWLQSQCIAVGDGRDYIKPYDKPVIDGSKLPEGFDRHEFRDPKIFYEGEGYGVVTVAQNQDGYGAVLRFDSADGIEWSFTEEMLACNGNYGRMWECPDYFRVDDKDVLLLSPLDDDGSSQVLQAGNQVIAFVGNYNKGESFREESVQVIDYGMDFYATQTLSAPDGRRIMTAWMASWDAKLVQREDQAWCNQLTIPRELSIREGVIYQKPVREIEKYYGVGKCTGAIIREGQKKSLDGIKGRIFDMTVILDLAGGEPNKFRINVCADNCYRTAITYDSIEKYVEVDRSHAGYRRGYAHIRRAGIVERGDKLELRILVDRFSVEVFVNGGRYAITTTIPTPESCDGITFESFGGSSKIDIIMHELRL